VPRAPLAVLVVLAACGAARSEPARPPASTAAAAPQPAAATVPAREPMSEASLAADLAWLTAPERAGRGSTTPEARATARWIAGELRAAGYTPIEQPIPDVPGQVNVIAELAAAATAHALAVIVVAHYDHLGVIRGAIHPGADDNASGVAVALAIARELRRPPISGRNSGGAGGRVLWLFTGAEEIGLRGARAFVAAPTLPLGEIRAVYNLDMVGRELAPDGAPQLAAVGLPGDAAVTDAALDAAGEAGLMLAPVPARVLRIGGQTHRTDDWAFRDAGIHAVHFSTGLGDDYHSPRDTLDKVSRPQLLRTARFLRALVDRTAR
jgi:Zn-dependent M28 family amino/carboxypeptidase